MGSQLQPTPGLSDQILLDGLVGHLLKQCLQSWTLDVTRNDMEWNKHLVFLSTLQREHQFEGERHNFGVCYSECLASAANMCSV